MPPSLYLCTHLKTRPVHCSSVDAISSSVLPCAHLMCTASILTRILPSLSLLHASLSLSFSESSMRYA